MSRDIHTTKLRKWLRVCQYLAFTVLAALVIAAMAEWLCEVGKSDQLYTITMGLGIVALGVVGLQGHGQWFNAEVEATVRARLGEEQRRRDAQLSELTIYLDDLEHEVEALSSEVQSGVVGRKLPMRPA